jgi:hypothetical protein
MRLLFLVFQEIRNPKQLSALDSQTYIISVSTAIVALGIAYVISNLISFEGGSKPRDPFKRRVTFIIVGLVSALLMYLYNIIIVLQTIAISLQDKFRTTALFSMAVLLIIYIICGFILSKILRTKKFGTIFASSRK